MASGHGHPMTDSPVAATWTKQATGATLTLHEDGTLIGRLGSVGDGRRSRKGIRIRMRAVGNAARTRWTLEEAQRRAAEYGFTREEQ